MSSRVVGGVPGDPPGAVRDVGDADRPDVPRPQRPLLLRLAALGIRLRPHRRAGVRAGSS